MPSNKLPVSNARTALDRAAPDSTSRLPNYLRFPLLVTLSLTASSLSYSLASEYIAGDFASVSRRLNNPWEVLGLLAWRASELAVGWYCGYDGGSSLSLEQDNGTHSVTKESTLRPSLCCHIFLLSTSLPHFIPSDPARSLLL